MTKDRKQALLQLLKEAPKALNGQSLAEHFHVTRQVIVQDIAILRADGAPIYRGGLGSARLFSKRLKNFFLPIVFCTARVEKFRFVRSFHHLHQR